MFAYLSARRRIAPGTRRGGVAGLRSFDSARRRWSLDTSTGRNRRSGRQEPQESAAARLAQKAESGHEINTVCCSTIMKLARPVGKERDAHNRAGSGLGGEGVWR